MCVFHFRIGLYVFMLQFRVLCIESYRLTSGLHRSTHVLHKITLISFVHMVPCAVLYAGFLVGFQGPIHHSHMHVCIYIYISCNVFMHGLRGTRAYVLYIYAYGQAHVCFSLSLYIYTHAYIGRERYAHIYT